MSPRLSSRGKPNSRRSIESPAYDDTDRVFPLLWLSHKFLSPEKTKRKILSEGKVRTRDCNISFSPHLFVQHLQQHESAVEGEACYYHCVLCNYSTKAKLNLIQHVRSMKHQRSESLRKLQRLQKGLPSHLHHPQVSSPPHRGVISMKHHHTAQVPRVCGNCKRKLQRLPRGKDFANHARRGRGPERHLHHPQVSLRRHRDTSAAGDRSSSVRVVHQGLSSFDTLGSRISQELMDSVYMDGRCLNSTAGSSRCCKLSEKAAAILGFSVNQSGLCLLFVKPFCATRHASDHQLPLQKVQKASRCSQLLSVPLCLRASPPRFSRAREEKQEKKRGGAPEMGRRVTAFVLHNKAAIGFRGRLLSRTLHDLSHLKATVQGSGPQSRSPLVIPHLNIPSVFVLDIMARF
ncbi:Zinc finger homeobox protein 3 [Bagarius yarrelli]|uniref:Zinc finger homeobox protein 3 n=1 Tax=Bagarius yarrelli TaxID=175774 RepID=A0A556VAL4_BAGYA|nr:Zinc finger homeobox protein 3 [Bagarius yarrelli]